MISNLRQLRKHKKNAALPKKASQPQHPNPRHPANPSQGANYRASPEGILNIVRHACYLSVIIIAPLVYTSRRIISLERERMLLAACIIIFGIIVAFVADQGLKRLITAQVHGRRVMQTTGIFGVSRHPFYLSQSIVMVGVVLLFPSWTVGALFIGYVAATWLTMRMEEENMMREFGEKYRDYAEKTPIVPWNILKLLFP